MNVWKAGQKVVEQVENFFGVLFVNVESALYRSSISIGACEFVPINVRDKLIQSLRHFGFQVH